MHASGDEAFLHGELSLDASFDEPAWGQPLATLLVQPHALQDLLQQE